MSPPSSAPADACPQCFPGDYSAVAPESVTPTETGSLRARYRHEACGHEWNCWWSPAASAWPAISNPQSFRLLVDSVYADLLTHRNDKEATG